MGRQKIHALCTISKSDCGAQIGYLNGETDDMICEYKDYPTDE